MATLPFEKIDGQYETLAREAERLGLTACEAAVIAELWRRGSKRGGVVPQVAAAFIRAVNDVRNSQ